jgi:Uma2 family endonuclease
MLTSPVPTEVSPVVVHLKPIIDLTDDQFFEFCQLNRDLHIERTADRNLLIMPPTGSETDNRNVKIIQQLANWSDRDGSGIEFGSSAGFTLPNGAVRSPDAAWIRRDRWEQLTPEQRIRFAPICPDFVIELRSPSDALDPLQQKMLEYLANGTQLGWLIDRQQQRVYIYRPDSPIVCLAAPTTLSGSPVLKEFVLDLEKVW